MKTALINIVDRHVSAGEESVFELTTSGSFELREGGCTVIYSETDEELADCTTVLEVEGERRISMTRTGSFNTELIIEKDRRHSCFYSTPFGEIMMGVFAKFISADLGESGGTLKFAYSIDFNNDLASENELLITVAAKAQEE